MRKWGSSLAAGDRIGDSRTSRTPLGSDSVFALTPAERIQSCPPLNLGLDSSLVERMAVVSSSFLFGGIAMAGRRLAHRPPPETVRGPAMGTVISFGQLRPLRRRQRNRGYVIHGIHLPRGAAGPSVKISHGT